MAEVHRQKPDNEALRDLRDETKTIFATLHQMCRDKENIMSKITDWAADEQVNLTAIQTALTNVVTGIAALDALITTFQNSPGTLAPDDQAALTAIQTASAALVAQSQAISVAPPVPAGS